MNATDTIEQKAKDDIMKTMFFMSICVFLIEWIVLGVMSFQHTLNYTVREYVMRYIVMPSAHNFLMCLILWIANRSKLNDNLKSLIMIWCVVKISASIAIVHSYYVPTQCVFVCSIIAASLFGRVRYIIYAFIDSLAMLTLSVLLSRFFDPLGSIVDKAKYMIISVLILLSAYVIAYVVMINNDRSKRVIDEYVSKLEEALYTAKLDVMTGLYNHNEFYNILYSKVLDGVNTITIAIMDIDHFKHVNDTYGHSNGDTVILKIAELAKKINNDTTVFASRYGGEEFAFIFIDADIKATSMIINTIREEVSDYVFDFDTNKRITISAGLFSCDPYDYTISDMFTNADAALYYSKNHGRDQLNIFDPTRMSPSPK